ncbi:peptidase family M13 protein [Histoplasma capsulatum]|uniref:Peptidase family M13 protein n=1 Tax=Ajellomyces capsulatus TaxID=5037 RepID=A0A8A1M212_AJECA|nr:hypothetical protein HCAG_06684 [Histoplasma mississippiense (nom. inval.)]EDN09517.1 hypothetical protein HCAG_06684 [Histoplasma mississippiense (nom. inval.)]QSS60109.1 peptidase family M13 protein [Histoplasma capsulatum]
MHPNPDSIDPCTNFDQLVCGGFYEEDIPYGQSSVSTLSQVEDRVQTALRHILENPRTNMSENFITLETSYNACMNKTRLEEIGAAPLQKLVDSVKLDADNQNSLADAIISLIDIGTSYPIDFGVDADSTNPDAVIVFVALTTHVGLPSPHLYNATNVIELYAKVMELVLGDFGGSDAASVVDFEKKLAEIHINARGSTVKYSLADAQALLPQISLERIISAKAPIGYKAEQIVIYQPESFKQLSKLLADTPTPILNSFLKWKVIQNYASDIEDPIIKPYRRFHNALSGKDPDSVGERWRKCVSAVNTDLGWILSKFFIEKAFSEEAKKFGDQIISDIKEVFVETLEETTWLSDHVRKEAIEKVGNIVPKVGYSSKSPDVRNAEALKNLYKDLTVTDAFFDNRVRAQKFLATKYWSKLGKPTNRDAWETTMPTVNAYYNPTGNDIVFPAGIMQNPMFYHPFIPKYLTYGAFGSVGGHELTHAFDNSGRRYDEHGNKTNWWDNRTMEEFTSRAECFVKQYSNFTIEGPDQKILKVNGMQTLGENIADAGGLKAAYRAWKKREAASPSQSLPGLGNYTHEQLFFISFGSVWCAKMTPQAAAIRVQTDVHSPQFARILGTVANSPQFREAFNCPVKEPTCDLW